MFEGLSLGSRRKRRIEGQVVYEGGDPKVPAAQWRERPILEPITITGKS